MSQVTLKGNPVEVGGSFLQAGQAAPEFRLVAGDLSEKSLTDFAGKRKVLNIFPSVDTGVCAASVRKFNEKAASLANTAVLCVSQDLPFAQSRFCGAEGPRHPQRAGGNRVHQQPRRRSQTPQQRLPGAAGRCADARHQPLFRAEPAAGA